MRASANESKLERLRNGARWPKDHAGGTVAKACGKRQWQVTKTFGSEPTRAARGPQRKLPQMVNMWTDSGVRRVGGRPPSRVVKDDVRVWMRVVSRVQERKFKCSGLFCGTTPQRVRQSGKVSKVV